MELKDYNELKEIVFENYEKTYDISKNKIQYLEALGEITLKKELEGRNWGKIYSEKDRSFIKNALCNNGFINTDNFDFNGGIHSKEYTYIASENLRVKETIYIKSYDTISIKKIETSHPFITYELFEKIEKKQYEIKYEINVAMEELEKDEKISIFIITDNETLVYNINLKVKKGQLYEYDNNFIRNDKDLVNIYLKDKEAIHGVFEDPEFYEWYINNGVSKDNIKLMENIMEHNNTKVKIQAFFQYVLKDNKDIFNMKLEVEQLVYDKIRIKNTGTGYLYGEISYTSKSGRKEISWEQNEEILLKDLDRRNVIIISNNGTYQFELSEWEEDVTQAYDLKEELGYEDNNEEVVEKITQEIPQDNCAEEDTSIDIPGEDKVSKKTENQQVSKVDNKQNFKKIAIVIIICIILGIVVINYGK
ncbi:hypothetical protein [Oceanirhabdus seepicola]|uniref:Uncharacterized protein n=1 Tax=Oceanirhabdus seepicola TaxID=2828781 RepID=A0A9J6NWC3_9CLOT|nr:hypothetical protein [Oceanirhabdus seepicola]MCM1988799.1 hypothetical protein [Oceanirhabdus seepicola]